MSNTIPGYAVHGRPSSFGDLAINNTFVTQAIKGAEHWRKVSAEYAELVDSGNGGQLLFGAGATVYQTIPTNREVVGVVGAAAGAAAFNPGDMIQLKVLPGIRHKAEIVNCQGDGKWLVDVAVNAADAFQFIVFEHQILAQQSYIVTGFTQVGIAGEGMVAFVPHVTIVRAVDSKQARNEALLERPGLKIVSVSDKSPEWEPAFFDAGGEVIWAATSA
jgi:hypothetical protein